MSGSDSQLWPVRAVLPWASRFTSLSLHLLACKMGTSSVLTARAVMTAVSVQAGERERGVWGALSPPNGDGFELVLCEPSPQPASRGPLGMVPGTLTVAGRALNTQLT